MRSKSEMKREDIIRMAREAKIDQLWGDDPLADWSVELTIFAALVAAAERERVTFELVNEAQRAVQEAVWAEREACAEVCDAQIQECAAKVTQILKQELEALETNSSFFLDKTAKEKRAFAITALRAALAENAMQRLTDVHQEIEKTHTSVDNEYTPVKPLTDEEIWRIDDDTPFHEGPEWLVRFTRAIERAHGIGGEE